MDLMAYLNEAVAIHCKTIEEAARFGEILEECTEVHGLLETITNVWRENEENTCYSLDGAYHNNWCFCDLPYYDEQGYEIIEFSALLNGDVMDDVEYNDGDFEDLLI